MTGPVVRMAIGALSALIALSATTLAASPAGAEGEQPSAPSEGPAAVAPPKRPHVDVLLQRRLHDSRIGNDLAMIVVDADSGTVISARGADRPMQAASNMKLVTATNAVATMGPGKRFATRVLAGAAPADLILQGGGDALLSHANVEELASRAATRLRRGARAVVHVDGDIFVRPTRAKGWVGAYLGNSVGYTQALAMRGDRTTHPSLNAARVFVSRLRELGVNARLGPNQDAAADAAVIATYRGHSVAQAVASMLRESDSGIAEVLFRQVAIASGRPTTWEGSRRAAMESLRALGVDPTGMTLIDGSGLSRGNRVTPRFLARVLRLIRVTEPERFAAIFARSALPTAGRTGTLGTSYGRYSSSPSRCAAGDVQAKTGTILRTIALSGIARTVFGGRRIFSIIVNDRPLRFSALSTRQAVDGLAATITGCWH